MEAIKRTAAAVAVGKAAAAAAVAVGKAAAAAVTVMMTAAAVERPPKTKVKGRPKGKYRAWMTTA